MSSTKTAIAAIDPGNGGTNGVVLNARGAPKFDYFPSVRARSLALDLDDKSLTQLKYETYDWYGTRYVIGNDVVHVTDRALERHRGFNRYGNEFHQFLVACSLARLGIPSGPVSLTLFAPPGLYNDARKAIKKAFEEQTLTISSKRGRVSHTFEIERVAVLPEGVGAVGAVAFDQTGQPSGSGLLAGRTAFIDIGAYTVDTLILLNGSLNPETMQRATVENQGIFTHVIEPVLATVHAAGDDFRLISQDAIDLLLQQPRKGARVLESAGFEIDLTDEIETQFRLYAEWLANNIIDTELSSLRGFSRVFLVGGGAEMLRPYLEKMYPKKIVKAGKDDPFFGVHPAYFNIVGGLRMTLNQMLSTEGL